MSVRPRVSKAKASKSTQRKKKFEDASSEDSEDAKQNIECLRQDIQLQKRRRTLVQASIQN